jgi:hypothetical protein
MCVCFLFSVFCVCWLGLVCLDVAREEQLRNLGSNAYAVFDEGVIHGSILLTRLLQSFPGPTGIARDDNLKSHDVRMDTPKHLKEAWGDEERGHTVESLMVPMVPTGTKLYWVHQLDSATSGPLCVGLNKQGSSTYGGQIV